MPPEVTRALDETLLWLCSMASPIGEERAICDAVHARLSKLALASPPRRYGDSIVARLSRSPGRPHVALVGHLDTVRTENGPARIEGGRCHGAGAADMKAGLAVMLVAAETLLSRFTCDVTVVFYAREEGNYAENELGRVLDEDPELRHVDLAVCLEPSDNRLQLGCCGSLHATVTFQGKTAHSARPWEGDNAITKAGAFLQKLGALEPIASDIDGLVFRTVTTATQARDGGRSRNVVPDAFAINVNHRFSPTTSLEEAQAYVTALAAPDGKVEFTDLSPAAMPCAKNGLVEQLVAAGVRSVEPKQAWTDVARFSAMGIAAVNFGPGESAQAHQKNESTALGLVHEGYAIVERWLTMLVPPASFRPR